MRQANELDKLEMVGQLRRALEVVYDKVALMVMLRFVALLHLLYFFLLQMVIHWDGTEWKFYPGLLS